MHYVIGDIHNELEKLNQILEQISPEADDHIYLLGDLFDRGAGEADPAGVYFKWSQLKSHCTWIRGNHDQWLAEYIRQYYGTSERKCKKLAPYFYNSFELLQKRLPEVDMLQLADRILQMPLQVEVKAGETSYLLAHAMASDPTKPQNPDDFYLTGDREIEAFFENGVEGYVSLVGHTPSAQMGKSPEGRYLDEELRSIWTNQKETVFLLDCGCGLAGGRLACMCLETGERFYA